MSEEKSALLYTTTKQILKCFTYKRQKLNAGVKQLIYIHGSTESRIRITFGEYKKRKVVQSVNSYSHNLLLNPLDSAHLFEHRPHV